ncbi:MAG: SpiroCoCo family coiled-coil protein [Treponema sp.]
MSILATILISATLSAVFCIIFKMMGKDNNSMEKVRRYADRRQSEFETYFAEKVKQLKLHSAELDGQQQQAVAAVNRLDKQIGAFKEMIVSLQKDTDAVHSIEAKINAYGEKISSLSEMTDAVEENLERIKQESNYVGKVSDKIDESRRELERLQGQIPAVSQEFKKYNAEQLKSVGIDLLKKYSERSLEIENSTKQAVKDYEELVNKLNSDVAGIYSSAAKKVENLEDSAFTLLSEKSEKRAEDYKNSMEKTFADLQDKIEKVQQRYEVLFDDAIQSADEKEKTAYEKYSATAKSHIESFKSNVEEKIKGMQDTIKQNLADLKAQTVNSAKEAKAAITELKSSCQEAVEQAKESNKEIDVHKAEVKAAISKFEKDTASQINDVNRRLEEAVKKAAAVYEAKQTENLIQLDKQLEQYKKDMQYRLQRIETSGTDIDNLEKVLRKSMDETQNHVLADFRNFTQATKIQSDNLAKQIAELESQMEELRQSTADNVSSRLTDFENEFTSDLKVREDKIQEDLVSWKENIDSRVSAFMTGYQTDREKLEEDYSENLKSRIDVLRSDAFAKINEISDEVKNSNNDISSQIDQMQKAVRDFVDQYKVELDTAVNTSEETLKLETEKHSLKIQEVLEARQNELLEQLDRFSSEISGKYDIEKSSIDSAIEDFKEWKQKLDSQFDDSRNFYNEKLETVRSAADDKALEVKNELDAIVDQYRKDTESRQSDIQLSIDNLDDRTQTSLEEYRQKSDEIIAQLGTMYDKMLDTTEERIKVQNENSEKKIKSLIEQITKAENDNRVRHSDMVLKIQNDQNDLADRLSDLKKEIKEVASQMSVFEKADTMRRQLKEEIDSLSQSFERLDGIKVAAEAFQNQFDALCSMNNEAEVRLEKFNAARKQIDSLEKSFNKLIVMSGTMDDKVRELQATNDDLQTMEVRIRDFKEALASISITYERLDKKSEVIDRISVDVDKSFEQLKELEQRLSNCNKQVQILPAEIKDVQSNVDILMKNTKHLDVAVEKLDSLNEVIQDTESRIEKIQNDREGIARTEARIADMSKSIDSKFAALKTIAEADTKKTSARTRSSTRSTSPQIRDNIRTLKQQGWTNQEIANSLNITLGEVELVLELPE